MKTKLLKLALSAMALLPMGAWADDNNVSTTTIWTFGSIANETTYSTYTTSYNYVGDGNNNLYARVLSSGNYTFTVKALAGNQTITFADGYTLTVSKVLRQDTKVRNPNYILSTATASKVVSDVYAKKNETTDASYDYNGTGMLAFNTTAGGTVYVVFKSGGSATKGFRIYHNDFGTTTTTVVEEGHSSSTVLNGTTFNTDGTLQYVSATTTTAGTFFIGDVSNTCDIYAVRFVPTTEKKDEWVYIGSTGYATWSNLSGKDIESLPSGLTAYKATAGNSGSKQVTLSSLSKMRRTQAYILKGTANTNYPLTYGGTSLTNTYNGGDMLRATADMANFAATITGNDSQTRYRYILGSDNGTAKFFVPSGSGTLKKGKAYLQTIKNLIPDDPGARGISIVFEDETTAVRQIVTKPINDGKYYNLQGIEVAQPTKGLYILNGRKVVIK